MAPAKGFHLVRENAEMYYWILKKNVFGDSLACRALFIYSFISKKKDREKYKLQSTSYLKL